MKAFAEGRVVLSWGAAFKGNPLSTQAATTVTRMTCWQIDPVSILFLIAVARSVRFG
jgi:hypothetical protein